MIPWRAWWQRGACVVAGWAGVMLVSTALTACKAEVRDGCGQNGDCAAGSLCLDGRCRVLCNASEQCPTTTPVCLGGYCTTATGECTSAAECVAPAPCQDAANAVCDHGTCVYQAGHEGEPCGDGNPCTIQDRCLGGSCRGTLTVCDAPPAPACLEGDTVYRSYPSTGTCDVATGACDYVATDQACSNCSVACLDACQGVACPDTNGGCRSLGRCVPSTRSCSYTVMPDGSACDLSGEPVGSRNGACLLGSCEECIAPDDCDRPPGGLAQCSLADCQQNRCVYTPIDGEGCPVAQCIGVAAGTSCDDGDPCTFTDRCNGASACVGTLVSCTDDPTTCGARRSCNGTSSCNLAFPSGTTCDDGAACTHTDRCNGVGGCVGTAISCTSDAGPCGIVRTCNGTSSCATSFPGTSVVCDDGAACTHTDRCNGAGGCAGTAYSCPIAGVLCRQTTTCDGAGGCGPQAVDTDCGICRRCDAVGNCVGNSIDSGDCGGCGVCANGTCSATVADGGLCGICGACSAGVCYDSCPSCPLVYTAGDAGYEYVSDVQGPILGLPADRPVSRSVQLYQPSYLRLPNLRPDADGILRVKVRESLEEITYFDMVRMVAVDHLPDVTVLTSSAENTYSFLYAVPHRFYTAAHTLDPVAAIDRNGADVLATLLAVDDEPAPQDPEAGVDHYYTLDFGDRFDTANAKLLLDAWSIYGLRIPRATTVQPFIEVLDVDGSWVVARTFGRPAGDLKTMVLDIANLFRGEARLIRLHIGIRYASEWMLDRVRLDDSPPSPLVVEEYEATTAALGYAGRATILMPELTTKRVALDDALPALPFALGYGSFTRYGDVQELLQQIDDRYAIMRHGDAVELEFVAPPPVDGMERTYFLKTELYYKGFEYNGNTVEPLPFHGMSIYPYPEVETYPTDPDHQAYRDSYNTRVY